ncbi:hypothetical protein J2S34_003167 [Nitrobacter winogradskyi]|uniref:Uncharacterized protein n=1 Tax=Nitrobacter winogradskyi TaxID=913 RepID=A0ACC6AM23_NITWI|nr:hypothetical protein [Nitrobacter winogradskyi]
MIAAKIEDVAILRYDFLNHCNSRDFTLGLWQQFFLESVQANTQILRGNLWQVLSQAPRPGADTPATFPFEDYEGCTAANGMIYRGQVFALSESMSARLIPTFARASTATGRECRLLISSARECAPSPVLNAALPR